MNWLGFEKGFVGKGLFGWGEREIKSETKGERTFGS